MKRCLRPDQVRRKQREFFDFAVDPLLQGWRRHTNQVRQLALVQTKRNPPSFNTHIPGRGGRSFDDATMACNKKFDDDSAANQVCARHKA